MEQRASVTCELPRLRRAGRTRLVVAGLGTPIMRCILLSLGVRSVTVLAAPSCSTCSRRRWHRPRDDPS
eukprot:scaffold23044_cov39-Tisochrysis_lutea.AAC.2